MFTLDHFPVWYRRAAEYPAGQFLYYMPRQETRGRGHTFTEQKNKTHMGIQNTLGAVLFLNNVQQVELYSSPEFIFWEFCCFEE